VRLSTPGSLPAENPRGPLVGYKLAYPVVSADDQAAGFTGLSIGSHRVYGVDAKATCPWSRRHSPPKRSCTCGFYCFHTLDAARAMACDTSYRSAVVLEVVAIGQFIRYEHGLRYARQRVRAVRAGRCKCGRPAVALTDTGSGLVGWRRFEPSCTRCGAWGASIALTQFSSLLGEKIVTVSDDVRPEAGPTGSKMSLAVVAAEVALLQARIDELQAQLARLSGDQS
jgi:hypothetical protein